MSNFEPWAVYSSLTTDRLSIVANIIRQVRHSAVVLHDPEAGDSAWSLGCRIYSRTCAGIAKAASQYDWLTVVTEAEPLCFTFAVGTVPFKFYRGSPDDPPSRLLGMTFGELHHQQLAFDIDGISLVEKILRIAVETYPSGEVLAISVVEMEKAGVVTGTYCIPEEFEFSNVTPLEKKPVDLPAPTLEPIDPVQEEKTDDGHRTDSISSVLG